MVIGIFDTRHFTFTIIGTSRKECTSLLKKAWKAHCKQFGMGEDNYYLDQFSNLEDDIRFIDSVQTGNVYRDGELIWKAK